MDHSANAILEAAMKLSEDERITLVTRILESMPVESVTTSVDDLLLREELDRRFVDRDEGIPWSELRAEG